MAKTEKLTREDIYRIAGRAGVAPQTVERFIESMTPHKPGLVRDRLVTGFTSLGYELPERQKRGAK